MHFELPTPKEFEDEVRKFFETNILGECVYQGCTEELDKLDLHEITANDVKRTIAIFLDMWGHMGRVLARYKGWENDLSNIIKKYANTLKELKEKNLAEISEEELDKLSKDIKKCYLDIRKIVGPTSAAKVLHVIAPSFFPMWDSRIREKYGVRTSGSGYIKFIKEIRNKWFKDKNLNRSLQNLKEELKLNFNLDVSELRLIDAYNWIVAWHRKA